MIDYQKLAEKMAQNSMIQPDDHSSNNLDPRLSLSGLWKNVETGEYECFFGSGRLVLTKFNEQLENGASFGLYYHFTDAKGKEVSSIITNLWVSKGKDCWYLSGQFGANLSLTIFKNDRKTEEKHPGQLIYLKPKKYRRKINPDEFELQ